MCPGVVIVLDDQHPPPDRGRRREPAPRRAASRGVVRSGKRTVNTLPAARPLARHLDATAVQVHEPPHQGEADAEPGRRPVEAGVALHEQVEDPGQEIGGDARRPCPPRRAPPRRRGPRWRRSPGHPPA